MNNHSTDATSVSSDVKRFKTFIFMTLPPDLEPLPEGMINYTACGMSGP